MSKLSNQLSMYDLEAGCDEAGRGCLAGPVTAAAVILPKNILDTSEHSVEKKWVKFLLENLNDSKKINEKKRFELKPIIEDIAISYAVSFILPSEIDEINILNASLKAMQECILKLETTPQYIIVDGNKKMIPKNTFQNTTGKIFTPNEIKFIQNIPNECIVKGDGKYLNIAAASILAKTYRDLYMEEIHEVYPQYHWKQNKGYPTKDHKLAILQYGLCEHHRKSFQWDKNMQQLKLDF
jgi:ribonuclease HII